MSFIRLRCCGSMLSANHVETCASGNPLPINTHYDENCNAVKVTDGSRGMQPWYPSFHYQSAAPYYPSPAMSYPFYPSFPNNGSVLSQAGRYPMADAYGRTVDAARSSVAEGERVCLLPTATPPCLMSSSISKSIPFCANGPSDREKRPSSLKHKILSEHSEVGDSVPSPPSSHSRPSQQITPYPPHFMKGAIIRLASGEHKPVEQLTTDDFVKSAELFQEVQLGQSTLLKKEQVSTEDKVILTFSVGEQQVTVSAGSEHPFFVFGQGWSSSRPDRTLHRYGLQCHQLSVGDICIILIERGGDYISSQKRKRRWSAPDGPADAKVPTST